MRQKKNKKHDKIDKILIGLITFSFILTILTQIYLNFFHNRIVFNNFYKKKNLVFEQLDIMPEYGEIKLKVKNEEKTDKIKILKNGNIQKFINGILKIQVKDGDLIEFENLSKKEKIKIKVIHASLNIENFKSGDIISISNNKIILIKIS
ncbi:hypothetical protein SAMN02745883_00074 [Caminicella sporogenes DSM 14501]|uniref:Uncharacterized protein n=1 Tax=Caminicella sporogenes DSM 14501 TaxID=1121266 RepID=A0A1M6L509_9FIRM|nr:hypothetical protein [Caminicella sporogenes]RKD27706.1 hypothetical protein BET04_01175 [Caminicella sporogenes]SHJ66266.1 hypothetical protein SAMN02745883_00074 [Caminicella sporogenes DSM 14501]